MSITTEPRRLAAPPSRGALSRYAAVAACDPVVAVQHRRGQGPDPGREHRRDLTFGGDAGRLGQGEARDAGHIDGDAAGDARDRLETGPIGATVGEGGAAALTSKVVPARRSLTDPHLGGVAS